MSLSRCGLSCVAALQYLRASPVSLSISRTLVPVNTTQLVKARTWSVHRQLHPSASMYITEERGALYSPDYRVYFRDSAGPISPLHDIPLWADKEKRLVNMVVEVPRWSNAKMEISLSEPLNPIKQDLKKGQMRFVANVFPHHGYIWNYGALPQTWENPHHIDADTQCRGDNDPIDVLEIGTRVAARGDVRSVKILGVLALIDEGETDWKLLAIDAADDLADKLNNVADIETHLPGLLKATVEWFRLYKVPDGKPINKFAFDGQAKDADFAYKVIDDVHKFWKSLVNGGADISDINKLNVTVTGSSNRVERVDAAAELAKAPLHGAPQALPPNVNKWHYLSNL